MWLPFLLVLFTSTITTCRAYYEPRLYSNESLVQHSILSTGSLPRDLFGRATNNSYCQEGQFACLDGTSRCCPTGTACCLYNQYCALLPATCCGAYVCSGEGQCCGGKACAPFYSNCCDDGRYCDLGMYCTLWKGRYLCCPASGCDEAASSGPTTTATASSETSTSNSISDTTSVPHEDEAPSKLALSAVAIGAFGVVVIVCILLLGLWRGTVLGRKSQKPEPVKETPAPKQGLSNPRDLPRGQQGEERIAGSGDQMRVNEKTGSSGWQSTLYLGSIASLMVLLFNTGFAAWAATKHTGSDSTGVIFSGQCQKARNINTALHLVINILATLVLAASSYGMQCLSAPTRHDLDCAHPKGVSLDIGILSLRNLSRIPRKKLILWVCLAVSSLPLHLLYNSTIFLTTGAFEYQIISGNRTFMELSNTVLKQEESHWQDQTLLPPLTDLRNQQVNGGFHRMDNLECINAYAVNFQSAYGTLLLVSETLPPSYGAGYFNYFDKSTVDVAVKSWEWMVAFNDFLYWDDLDQLRAHADNLTINTFVVDDGDVQSKLNYCLAQKLPEMCQVKYSLPLLIVVIVFNIVKAGILWGVTVTIDSVPLLTVGDAVAEFLKRPDCFTFARDQSRYDQERKIWYTIVSKRRWAGCIILFFGSLIVSVFLLFYGINSDGNGGFSSAWELGIGAADTRYLIQGRHHPSTVAGNTMMANTPQVVYSFLYFIFNGALTAMAQAHEWSQYAVSRKGLRVSTPAKGEQRSTYFLSLPYRYSIPQLIFSMTLHWLISQSLFLVDVEAYSPTLARIEEDGLITCGYSPLAIVCTLTVGSIMGLCLAGLACFQKFKSGMPIAGSSSLAISASCHPSPALEESTETHRMSGIEMKQLQWGVVTASFEGAEHCSFSDEEVRLPVH